MIRVKLNDNTFVDVEGTADPRQAAAAGRRWFQQNRPEEFEAWRRSQLGLGSSVVQGASAGIDQFQSTLYSAAEGLGRATGDRNLERFGRTGRVEQQLQAETAFPSELRQAFTDVEDVGGGARAVTEAITGSLPSTAAGITGALAGARASAAGGLRGRVVGGILGGAGASFPQLFGSNIERQIEESGDIVSPGAAAAAAAVQAPLESAADVATLGAARILRRPATEAAQAVGAGLGRRIAMGAAAGGATELPVEIAQTALERAQAGLPLTGPEATREYTEAGLGGLAGGAFTGGALGGAFGQRPTPTAAPTIPEGAFGTAPAPTPTPAPEAAGTPVPAPLTLPDRPEPFTSPEEARAYLAERNIQIPIQQPEAITTLATAARTQQWQADTASTRLTAINDFFPRAPDNNQLIVSDSVTNLASAANRGDLNLNSFSPTDVAKTALASRDIDPARVSKAEVRAAREQLDALVEIGLVKKNVVTVPGKKGKKASQRETATYAINFDARPEAQSTVTPSAAPEAAAQPAPVPPATQGAPIPEAAPAPPAPQAPAGFKTALGSTYAINDQGQTIRTKQSPGRGQGKTYAPHNALFVTPDEANNVLEELRGGNTYRFIVNDPAGPRRTEPGESLQGKQVALGIFRPDGSVVRYVPAQMRPAVGLSPVELRVEGTGTDRKSFRHIGNPITELAGAPAARTTVEVGGVQRETTPATVQQTVNEMRAAPRPAQTVPSVAPRPASVTRRPTVGPAPAAAPTPAEGTLAKAAATAEPASGAGEPTATAEEAVVASPKNFSIKQQQQTLNKQREAMFEGPAEGFRGGVPRKWFASPLTGLARQPEYQGSAEQGTRLADRKLRATTEFTELYTPMQELSAESQIRTMLTLQEARSRQQMWNRDAFTPEENQAMDNVLAMGQRGLDFYIDAATNKFFNPAEAKTPQDRARLEAFQQAKGDRLITELSDADLRAASEAGAKEIRRLNQRRDQFFFPQVSKGTHFVAAYERLPGGKEKIARIYFYDPLNFAQRQRARVGAQRDFEALAAESLRREFPDTGRFRLMTKGREAENDSRVADLRRDGEFIAQYLQQLSQVSSKESKQILERMAAEINKAQMDRFFRPNNDILRAVTPWNAVDYARETLPNYFLALSNIQGRLLIQDDFNRAMDGYSPEEKRFWNDWLNINSTPVEAFGTGRALAGAWFLGGNISTAMMQLTQNFVTLPARFARDGGLAASSRHMASAARDVYGTSDVLRVLGKEMEYTKRLIASGVLSTPESTALKRASLEGVIRPSQITNIRGQFEADTLRGLGIADQSAAKFAAGANKVVDVSFRMLSTVDETNRAVAFLAALRLATSNPEVMLRAGRLDNRTYETPYDYARAVVDETNFRGGVDDQPLITRFHPVAQMVTQFLTPSFKFIELFARSGAMAINGLKNGDPVMAKAGALQFALMMAPQVILAGIWSLPFADRLKDLMEFLLKQAGMQIDLEQEIEKLGVNSLTASTINFGLLHAIGAITLSERLKIDVLPQGSLSEWDVFSVLGPVGGLIEKPTVAHAAWQLGDYWGVGYALLPASLSNVLKGIQIGTTGEQYTRRGGRIIAPEDVQRAAENGAFPPALQQAIGFAPTEFTNIRRAVQRQRDLQDAVRDPTEKVNIELSRILLRHYEARLAGRADEADARVREFRQRAAEIEAEQRNKPAYLQVRVNPQAINQRALQDLQGRGSLEALLRRAPASQREEIRRMYERTVGPSQ